MVKGFVIAVILRGLLSKSTHPKQDKIWFKVLKNEKKMYILKKKCIVLVFQFLIVKNICVYSLGIFLKTVHVKLVISAIKLGIHVVSCLL